MIALPSKTDFVFEKLCKNGFECFAVGGCVRDLIIGYNPKDFDFTTNAEPEKIKTCFSEYKTLDIGAKYGTITVINEGESYEITTYRVDGDYNDSRHPDFVEFSGNICDDLSRRDFTVNSIAYNEKRGFVDPFGGIEDIRNRIIRATGEPEIRFREDSLRILRALRFSAKLGFDIESKTKEAMFSSKDLLLSVHPQRVKKELEEFLLCDIDSEMLMTYKDILAVVIPELIPMFETEQNTPHHIYNVYEHTAHAVANTPADISLRLAALLHDCGKPSKKTTDKNGVDHFRGHPERSVKFAENALLRMGFPFEIRQEVLTLIKFHDERYKMGSYDVKKVLSSMSYGTFLKLCTLSRADIMAQAKFKRTEKLAVIDFAETEAKRIIEAGECYSLKMLNITGDDLVGMGYSGMQIGKILNELLDLVMRRDILNEKYELICFAKSMFDKSQNII